MKQLIIFAVSALYAGTVALGLAAGPTLELIGIFAIVASVVALAGVAAMHVMHKNFIAHVLRSDEFHWNEQDTADLQATPRIGQFLKRKSA